MVCSCIPPPFHSVCGVLSGTLLRMLCLHAYPAPWIMHCTKRLFALRRSIFFWIRSLACAGPNVAVVRGVRADACACMHVCVCEQGFMWRSFAAFEGREGDPLVARHYFARAVNAQVRHAFGFFKSLLSCFSCSRRTRTSACTCPCDARAFRALRLSLEGRVLTILPTPSSFIPAAPRRHIVVLVGEARGKPRQRRPCCLVRAARRRAPKQGPDALEADQRCQAACAQVDRDSGEAVSIIASSARRGGCCRAVGGSCVRSSVFIPRALPRW